ncbi:MAG: metallophosphoesterase family protein [Actinobacteria bacterium]|nr:metallophosphoesterase family protein [Actinomycetota bacterium]
MRLGLISDLHGNLFALEAVLDEFRDEQLDQLVCLGDIAVGPQPAETIARLRELDCPVVMGNWDAYFVSGFPEPDNDLDRRLMELGAWWKAGLSDADLEYLRGLSTAVRLPVDDGFELLAFHGSPRSSEDRILPTTPDEQLDQMLGARRAQLMVGGHTHFQMVRRHGEGLVVNPGSVGLPFERQEPVMRVCPWAEYGIVEARDGSLSVDLRRTSFDVGAHLNLMRRSGMPHVEWWTGLWATSRDGTRPRFGTGS